MNELITVNYSVDSYKNEIQEFYKKLKNLFLEIEKLNKNKEILKLKPTLIKHNFDLENNKICIDIINTLFKPLEIINNDIKKTLNNWKSNFAGSNGLDQYIKELKNKLIQQFKDEQLKYDSLIQEKIINKEINLKEQSEIKTTIGIRTYKVIVIDEINIELLDRKYLLANKAAIKLDIKADNNINIRALNII